ncbi:thiamine kinase [Kosakonia oryzendophytica]|nr:thiamine kinase [Kosakonia oryzendophytica]AMO49022.1 Aminoglycoside phosphotransferase [Enterobacter sp. FY-07]WBT56490.1 thiamine kinase [Kosakonia oryzendophytica]
MRFSNNKPTRDDILSRYFPQYAPVASQNTGLSGGSCLISDGLHTRVLRQRHQSASSPFRRQYRVFKHLPPTIAPRAHLCTGEWMAIDYLPGETKTVLPPSNELAALLYDLHRQACFGWRITLLPLLEGYWQRCAPDRRTPFWLRRLKRLRQQGEPVPLRLAPLHMDVHVGNLVHGPHSVRLIDWEYAGDGDIALELAAVWMDNDAQRRALVEDYARCSSIAPAQLWRQVRRWRPWVLMLMAGWYECRWQQTGEQQFITLANEVWRQLQTEG